MHLGVDRSRRLTALALFVVIASPAYARTVTGRVSGGGEIMTNEKVIQLTQAKVPEDVILDMVTSASRSQFDMTTRGVTELQKAGVTPDVMRAMRQVYREVIRQLDTAVRVHIQMLRSEIADDYDLAVRTLVRTGAYAVPLLIDNLGSEDERIRAGVCEVLGRIGDPPSLDPLFEALLDRNRAVRARAARAVAMFDKNLTVPRLKEAIERRGVPRDGYALALGYVGDVAFADVLRQVVEQLGPENDRSAAAYALGLLDAPERRTVNALLDAVTSDTERELREAAARALGRLAGRMDDDSRQQSAMALSRSLQRYAVSRVVVAEQLRAFPTTRTVEALIEFVGSRDRDLSEAAWQSLRAVTGEHLPQDDEQWRAWWVFARTQPRWQEIERSSSEETANNASETDEPSVPVRVERPRAPEDPFIRR